MTAVAEKRADRVTAQFVYYAGWLFMLLIEAVLWSALGVVLGIASFVLGGTIWGWWQAAQTSPGERLRGPVLQLTHRLVETGKRSAFLGAVLLGGPPGVGAAVASSGRTDTRRIVLVASVVYSLVFVVFHVLRPPEGLPMHLWPRL